MRKGSGWKFCRLAAFCALFTVAVLLCSTTPGALAAGSPQPYRIIHPTDEEHKLLPKTCSVCHKDAVKFFIVSAKDKDVLEAAMRRLTGAKRQAATQGGVAAGVPDENANPHTKTTCFFCHTTKPEKGTNPTSMQYRSVTGGLVELADTEGTCRLCHPEDNKKHIRVIKSARASQPDLARAGLPTPGKKVLCITCHDMHSREAIEYSLRAGFFEFSRTSVTVYPHAQQAACTACHPSRPEEGAERAPRIEKDSRKLCARCHGGDHSSHTVGGSGSVDTYPMDFLEFPLGEDENLVCTTCHDEPCDIRINFDLNTTMLRGGPYYRMSNFCDKCHPKAGPGRVNPHKQIDDNGQLVSSTCTFCHITDPDDGEYGPGDMNYVESRIELCTLCHETKPHPTVQHISREVKDRRLDSMQSYERRHSVLLPLDENNRMECTTCHNAHDKGVLSGLEALGAGEELQLRIPSFAEMCTPCHARYD